MKNIHANWFAITSILLASAWSGSIPAAKAQDTTEEVHQTFPLADNGRVSLDNVNGAIEISTWDRAEVKVDAVKRAKTTEALSDINIDFKAEGDWVSIKTRLPKSNGRQGGSGSVDYHVTVPRKVRLDKINSVNGAIVIEGVNGEIRASTVNGALKAQQVSGGGAFSTVNGSLNVAMAKLDDAGQLSLETVNGKVSLALPANASASLKANTVNGAIHNDFDLPVKKGSPVGNSLEGQLGNGGPTMTLKSVNGAIQISKSE
jgi:hypothetical protein